MRRLSLLVVLCCLPVAPGCTRSLSSVFTKDKQTENRPPQPATSHRTASAGDRSSSAGVANRSEMVPLTQLSVGNEQLQAESMVKDLQQVTAKIRSETPPESWQSAVERRAAQSITDKVTESLLYQRAALRLGPEVDEHIDKYVDEQIRKVISTEHDGIQRRYEKSLAAKGVTFDEARADLRREMIVASYLETEIKPNIAEPTRAQLLDAFAASADKWRRPARRQMSLMEVRVTDRLDKAEDNPSRGAMDEARDKARSIAETARAEIESGTPFAEVAIRRSDGLHAAEGGSWGWVTPDSVRERFAPALDALQRLAEGGVSDIVETGDAFFIVKCEAIDTGFEPTFQTAQPMLKEQFYRVQHNQLVGALLTELRESAEISAPEMEQFHLAVVQQIMASPVTSD